VKGKKQATKGLYALELEYNEIGPSGIEILRNSFLEIKYPKYMDV